MGPISIFIAATNVVPIGSIATPAAGASQPSTMPAPMATSTQKYSCRYHGVVPYAVMTVVRPR